jgi:REP element-mobilizing transposase RayT
MKRWPDRPRLKGFEYQGAFAYHIVFNTAHHSRVLIGALADAVVEALEIAASSTDFDLCVYTIMPDHVHVLLQGTTDASDVVRFVQRAKQKPGFDYKRATGEHLWLPSFYDRIVRRGDDAREIAAYIWANPIRAGLMREGAQWPYSGGSLLNQVSL